MIEIHKAYIWKVKDRRVDRVKVEYRILPVNLKHRSDDLMAVNPDKIAAIEPVELLESVGDIPADKPVPDAGCKIIWDNNTTMVILESYLWMKEQLDKWSSGRL